MNNDFISRSALLADIQDAVDNGGMGGMVAGALKRYVKRAPAVEAVPVRTGRWVMTLYTTTSKRGRVISNKKYACSECGYSNGRKQSDYCPNCGANMEQEAE